MAGFVDGLGLRKTLFGLCKTCSWAMQILFEARGHLMPGLVWWASGVVRVATTCTKHTVRHVFVLPDKRRVFGGNSVAGLQSKGGGVRSLGHGLVKGQPLLVYQPRVCSTTCLFNQHVCCVTCLSDNAWLLNRHMLNRHMAGLCFM
jgi:hypothetical protein